MKRIAGVDEVGRGPLAGPVTAAAAVFSSEQEFSEFTDSKKLTEKKRETLFDQIIEHAYDWAIVSAGPITIDHLNIRQATHLCMKRAVELVEPDHAFIDGNMRLETSVPHETIVKGDSLHFAIGAASILAKVWRDALMIRYDALFPEYGFAKHKGYPAPIHLQALGTHGTTPLHRYSYRPVRECGEARPQAKLCSGRDLFILHGKKQDDPRELPELGELWGGADNEVPQVVGVSHP